MEWFFNNHNAESGLSWRLDKGTYFFILLSMFLISTSLSIILSGLFSSTEESSISSSVNCPEIIGLYPTIPFATSPSAIPCTSTSCNLQKSAICLNVYVVFSTNQTAGAIGIKGAFDI